MRTWVKVTLAGFAVVAVAFLALAGTGAYFVVRHMEKQAGSEVEAARAIETIKERFGSRPPLVEIVDPRKGDIRINRPADVSSTPVDTVHIFNWKRDTGDLMRTSVAIAAAAGRTTPSR